MEFHWEGLGFIRLPHLSVRIGIEGAGDESDSKKKKKTIFNHEKGSAYLGKIRDREEIG